MVTTDPEPRLAALLRERELASTGDASAALDALLACSSRWPTSRLLYECVAAAAEIAAANQVALYAFDGVVARCVALAPRHLESPLLREQLETRFPWGIPSLQPSRFVLVEHAEKLSIGDTSQLGDLGLVSALHLPLEDQGRRVGAMQLYWESRVEEWDDRCGALLRALGVFVLDRLAHFARTPDVITDVPPERI